ncbi:SulP family inorganic anion transporter [Roseitranquillus sediminis]|uniref:SulP family inorganic anion transporter n=1 Tax=Roseitranquillus sediminis TaxID=2809051 RepID=UPI003873B7AD
MALPLSVSIAIASGATPAQRLYTAVVGGFIVSLLGGSPIQIGGPAGAFIVLVAATVAQHGMNGLILATLLSGLMLVIARMLRLGTFIKFIPFPVTVGFTSGSAVIIFASQIRELFGLTPEHEPGELLQKIPALWDARAKRHSLRRRRVRDVRRRNPGIPPLATALATHAVRRRSGCRGRGDFWICRSRPSAGGSAASPRPFQRRACATFRWKEPWPFCPPPSCSPCSAPSSRSCPRSSPTA